MTDMTDMMNWKSMLEGGCPGKRYFVAAVDDGGYRPTTAVFLRKGDTLMKPPDDENPLWGGRGTESQLLEAICNPQVFTAEEDGFYEVGDFGDYYKVVSGMWAEMPFTYSEDDERMILK